ncbi:MAG: hypothetical protein AB7V42_14295 [Thermoleophilia bacterium]
MALRRALTPRYASGRDYAVEVAGVRFHYGADDFAERVGAAAVALGLLRRDQLDAEELADLVALAAHGRIEHWSSPLAAHIDLHRDVLLEGPRDLVHWLRRLVFRGAWIDSQVAGGTLEPVFEPPHGFAYRGAREGAPRLPDPPLPDWSIVAYGETA